MVTKPNSNRPSYFMWSTFAIITVCYILAHVMNRKEIIDLALKMDNAKQYNWLTQEGHWYRYFTHSFMHVSFLHYFMNMFNFVVIYGILKKGQIKETYLILVYTSSVILGGFGHMLLNYGSIEPTILLGASGGVFGLIGMLIVLYYNNGEYYLLRLTFLIDLPMNTIISLMVPKISWIAHLTGFVIGVSVGIITIQKKHQHK
jgi:rhomboid protease GluP